ncbi:hypothetical protein [Rhizobium sp. L1K21]|uniref:hypothetical protein n=1 Tax=Rhizobium sp. L1K21 TaxID=2954933 RepID=UPI0020935117|nr:hypothetical protein [Rhizobium sp. L1K21]MCO6187801.1 hypothetical protein [Rhizobium sp. L1K21]
MRNCYCDIVPHPDGWTFLMDRMHGARFPTFELAYEAALAATRALRKENRKVEVVMRQKNLGGHMQELHRIN